MENSDTSSGGGGGLDVHEKKEGEKLAGTEKRCCSAASHCFSTLLCCPIPHRAVSTSIYIITETLLMSFLKY
jgi:hypothetical protein